MNDTYDVLRYGPIVYPSFNDVEEARELADVGNPFIITINGAYLNLWAGNDGFYGWQSIECRYVGDNVGNWSLNRITEKAKAFYDDFIEQEEDSGDLHI